MNNNAKEPRFSEFMFSIGGFSQGIIRLELAGNSIIKKCNDYCEEDIYTPALEDWIVFSESLRNLEFWDWEREYSDPLVLDGTQWELSIQEGAMKKSCYGSNDFPLDFGGFISSVNQLVKADVISEIYMLE